MALLQAFLPKRAEKGFEDKPDILLVLLFGGTSRQASKALKHVDIRARNDHKTFKGAKSAKGPTKLYHLKILRGGKRQPPYFARHYAFQRMCPTTKLFWLQQHVETKQSQHPRKRQFYPSTIRTPNQRLACHALCGCFAQCGERIECCRAPVQGAS